MKNFQNMIHMRVFLLEKPLNEMQGELINNVIQVTVKIPGLIRVNLHVKL
jgi:hypothetical protein